MGRLLFRWIFVYIGVYLRYIFYIAIGKRKSTDYLKGKLGPEADYVSHDFINVLIGVLFIILLLLGIAKIIN